MLLKSKNQEDQCEVRQPIYTGIRMWGLRYQVEEFVGRVNPGKVFTLVYVFEEVSRMARRKER